MVTIKFKLNDMYKTPITVFEEQDITYTYHTNYKPSLFFSLNDIESKYYLYSTIFYEIMIYELLESHFKYE